MTRTLLMALCLCVVSCPLRSQESTGGALGLASLHRLDLLPRFHRSVSVGSVSSYDRTGGNDDGFSGKYSYVAQEDGGLVIADLKGPGVIYRIWTPTPSEDPVEFYFDGETTPRLRVPLRDLFTGEQAPFLAPLVGHGAGGFFSYVPLAYRESCKLLVRGERVQFYQINYARYPDDVALATWQSVPTEAEQQHWQQAAALLNASGSDIGARLLPPGVRGTTHTARVRLEPGKTAELFATDQPGRIAGIRLRPATALAGKQRDLLLRIRWDDERQPAVLCPAGDFFGYAWGRPAMRSLLVGTDGDVDYCYFPMPFDRSATLELVSQRTAGPPVELEAEVTWAPRARGADEGKFRAVWRRENPTTEGVPFTFLETTGRGHVVGCVLQAQGLTSGNTYFFEGDDATTLDGQLAVHGTGSEDFFNGGWYDVPGRWERQLSFPLSGCLGYQKHLGRTGGYRLMLGDAYAFGEHIRHTIEHAPTGNSLLTDYCGLTFLYLDGELQPAPVLPDVQQRGVVDFTRILFTPSWYVPIHAFTFRGATLSKQDEQIDGQKVSFLSMRAEGPDWFGPPFLSLVCDIPAAGSYAVSIEAVRGPGQGQVQLFQNETPVGEPLELYAAQRQQGPLSELGTLSLAEGPAPLMFKLVGKHAESSGLGFDLVTIQCDRVD